VEKLEVPLLITILNKTILYAILSEKSRKKPHKAAFWGKDTLCGLITDPIEEPTCSRITNYEDWWAVLCFRDIFWKKTKKNRSNFV